MAVALTVIVKDENGKLLDNAEVAVTPGDFTATTNQKGEAQLTVDGANRYQVTVSADKSKQTVPFYVVGKQKTARLEVNLQYFKQLNEVKGQSTQVSDATPWYQTNVAYAGYAIAFLIVIAVIVRIIIKKRKTAESAPASDLDAISDPEEVSEVASSLRKNTKKKKSTKTTKKKKSTTR